ncbi:MAG: hypothetical protein JW763_05290 [candidate division Zixibacteria bacterium]|nr:hypothetical protein [candidate division Zixibacteria bacterium]
MRKKVLLVEQSDAIRTIAESLLHQNGYDVIDASNADKAKALIITSQPNLLIIGADMKDSQGTYLYDALSENDATAGIPILFIADPDGRQIPYPDEVILPRPFDPKEFVERVVLFVGPSGQAREEDKIVEADPFSSGSVDDEILDAALGMDQIEVEDSEEMNSTQMTGKLRIPVEPVKDGPYVDGNDTTKVESLMIRDEDTQIKKKEQVKAEEEPPTKLELAQDQYGLMEPDALEPDLPNQTPAEPDHDYDWFINEMQKDVAKAVEGDAPAPKPGDKHITKTGNSEYLEQIGPQKKNAVPAPTPAEIRPGGVDDFISEFKKEVAEISKTTTATKSTPNGKVSEQDLKSQFESEIDQITDEQPLEERATFAERESMPQATTVAETDPADATGKLKVPVEGVDPEEIRHFCNYLAELLAEKLAKKIADRINREELLAMAREELPKLVSGKK